MLSSSLLAVLLSSQAFASDVVFKAPEVTAPFIEFFDDSWESRWKPSEAVKQKPEGYKEEEGHEDLFRYRGEWSVEAALKNPLSGKNGLVAKTAAAHHAISVAFPKVIDPSKKGIVVQYELKLQKELECGGAYIKLLTESPTGINANEFDDKTPYTIMFGPDKCGSTNKVHFIFRHQSPVTKKWNEHHLKAPSSIKTGENTNVYTLAIKPDNTFEIYINLEKSKSGSLLEDFEPPVNPPKEIYDKDDVKPEDWEDDAKIPDPDAVKPDDWDEEAPKQIPDEDAVKPEKWLDDAPEYIPDPEATKPEDWDDDEDGNWVAPTVPNPDCEEAGCGEWKRPMKLNPAYKGKWYAPLIDNPKYKGPWTPRMVPNPDYFEDMNPSRLSKIMGIGIEIWTMQPNIMFDSFYVGHSLEDAFAVAKASYELKKEIEIPPKAETETEEEAENEEVDADADPSEPKTKKTKKEKPLFEKYLDILKAFLAAAVEDPVSAFKKEPVVGVSLVLAFLAPTILYLLLSKSSKEVDEVGKRKKEDISTEDDKPEQTVKEQTVKE